MDKCIEGKTYVRLSEMEIKKSSSYTKICKKKE